MKKFGQLAGYLKPYKGRLALAVILLLASSLASAVMPLVLKRAVDSVAMFREDSSLLIGLVVAFVAFGIAKAVFGFLARRRIAETSRDVEYRLRERLFSHLMRLSGDFYSTMRTGDIMSRVINDLEAIRMALGFGLGFLLTTAFVMVFYVAGMTILSWELTIYALMPIVLISVVVKIMGGRMHVYARRIQTELGKISTYVQENFAGSMLVKAFVAMRSEVTAFSALNNVYKTENLNMVRVNVIGTSVMSLLNGTAVCVVLFIGGGRIIDGVMTVGDLLGFSMYLFLLVWPMIALGFSVNLFLRAASAIDRINNILDFKSSISEPDKPVEVKELDGSIEIKDLNYSYSDKGFSLTGVNMDIKKGQKIGIVGMTASGKTTLISILLRLFPVERGSVFFDGIDINDIPLTVFRRWVIGIPQDGFLFSSSIKDNLVLGASAISGDKLISAVRTANLEKDLEQFSRGIEQVVGERGGTLSGGQRQRVTIARALLKDANVYVFDDSFSNLDADTEKELIMNVDKELAGRTRIIIAHRISTIIDADIIYVMENGRVTESGRHQELLDIGGIYASLHNRQRLEDELERSNGR